MKLDFLRQMRDQNIHTKKSCATNPPRFVTRNMIYDEKIWDETLMEDGTMLSNC